MPLQNLFDSPFYRLPATSIPYPDTVPLGQILLFEAPWGQTGSGPSKILAISTVLGAYPEGYVFSIATLTNPKWIAFNLPEGTVCTLFGHAADLSGQPAQGSGGVTVDLIGNGAVQTVDISDYDSLFPEFGGLIGGYWRQVDYGDGWFQLFQLPDQQGPFQTFFFSDYSAGTPVPLGLWSALTDDDGVDGGPTGPGSVNFMSLTPAQVVTLNATRSDGTSEILLALGATNLFGSNLVPASLNLADRGLSNAGINSFTFTFIEPVKAFADSVTVPTTLAIDIADVITENIVGTNYSSETVQIATQAFENLTTTVTNTTTMQYTNSTQSTVSTQVKAGFNLDKVVSLSAQVTVTNQSTTTTQSTSTKTVTTTQELQLGQTITFTAPPSSTPVGNGSKAAPVPATYSAKATISLGTIQGTPSANSKVIPNEQVMTTTGHFYYRQNLPGSQPDPAGSGLFILDMPITIAIAGSIGTQITFDVDDFTSTTAAQIIQASGAGAPQPSLSASAAQPVAPIAHAVPVTRTTQASHSGKRKKAARTK